MRPGTERLLAAFLLLVPLGCSTLSLPLSPRFLVTEKDSDTFRAITPDEARVQVREFTESGGNAAFWEDALKRNLVEGRGYVLLKEQPVRTRAGRAGMEMVFETTAGGRTVRYLLVLFVTPRKKGSRIRVVEYVADKATFEKYVEEVRTAVQGS